MLTTKYSEWRHEREFRIIHENRLQKYYWQEGALTGLYFGASASKDDIQKVIEAVEGVSDIALYQMHSLESTFGLEAQKLRF